jgi:hypothetical protein
MTSTPDGWFQDPFALHEARYISHGKATKLVRDGASESYDPPPTEVISADVLHAAPSHGAPDDRPQWVSEGQEFERQWQGGDGSGDGTPGPEENMVDRLIIPVLTPLPSQRNPGRSAPRRILPTLIFLLVVGGIGALFAFGAL